ALRVPFMVQWKGTLPKGKVYEKPVSSLDIYATAAASAKAKAPKNIEGVDLVPYLTGKRSDRPHETLFWRQGGKSGLRHGDLKLVRMGGRKGVGNSKWELYDLSNDLSEEKNLARSNPERLAELVVIWEKMNGEMSKAMF
ncbi:MAG: N-acetylgalactosamine-4-sulfatase, partial [Opitutales bacterium]|nr:N-acetylgalactosamine-4-sulfatase [Opitutales bacterium]